MEDMLKKISQSKRLSLTLHVISHVCACFFVVLFLILEYNAFCSSLLDAVLLSAALGVPFVLVTAFRLVVNAPRPYEVYDIFDKSPKKKKGCSFPSRHAFSSFAIALSALPHFPVLAAIGIALSLVICVVRVLIGIHFIRDVAAGALIGIATAVLGIILL